MWPCKGSSEQLWLYCLTLLTVTWLDLSTFPSRITQSNLWFCLVIKHCCIVIKTTFSQEKIPAVLWKLEWVWSYFADSWADMHLAWDAERRNKTDKILGCLRMEGQSLAGGFHQMRRQLAQSYLSVKWEHFNKIRTVNPATLKCYIFH